MTVTIRMPPMVGVPALVWCVRGPFLANELADLQLPQAPDHPRSQNQPQKKSREAGERRAHGDVAKDVEQVRLARRDVIDEVVEHFSRVPAAAGAGDASSASGYFARSASTMRSIFTPRDPFTSSRSPGRTKSGKKCRGGGGVGEEIARATRACPRSIAPFDDFRGLALHGHDAVELLRGGLRGRPRDADCADSGPSSSISPAARMRRR